MHFQDENFGDTDSTAVDHSVIGMRECACAVIENCKGQATGEGMNCMISSLVQLYGSKILKKSTYQYVRPDSRAHINYCNEIRERTTSYYRNNPTENPFSVGGSISSEIELAKNVIHYMMGIEFKCDRDVKVKVFGWRKVTNSHDIDIRSCQNKSDVLKYIGLNYPHRRVVCIMKHMTSLNITAEVLSSLVWSRMGDDAEMPHPDRDEFGSVNGTTYARLNPVDQLELATVVKYPSVSSGSETRHVDFHLLWANNHWVPAWVVDDDKDFKAVRNAALRKLGDHGDMVTAVVNASENEFIASQIRLIDSIQEPGVSGAPPASNVNSVKPVCG